MCSPSLVWGFVSRVDFTEIVKRGTSMLLKRAGYTSRTLRPGLATIVAEHPGYDDKMERAAALVQDHSVATHKFYYARQDRLKDVRPVLQYLMRNIEGVPGVQDAADDEPEVVEGSNGVHCVHEMKDDA